MPPSDEEIDRVHSVMDYYEKHEFEVLNEFDEKKMTKLIQICMLLGLVFF